MADWQPDKAGPQDTPSLFHWCWKQFKRVGELIGDEGGGGDPGHVHNHDNLLNVTPDQHHNQVHLLYGPDHSDVNTATPLALEHQLKWDGAAWVPDYRVKGLQYVNGTTYYPQQMVFQDGWLMVANTETTDYPAPTPIGDPAWTLPDVPAWDADGSNASVVYTGHFYQFLSNGYFRGLRVWVPTLSGSTNYRFVIARNPNSLNPTYMVIEEPVLNEDDWTVLAVDTVLVLAGEELLIYIDALDTGGTSDFGPEQWLKIADSNATVPASGEWNFNQNRSVLRINKIDANLNDWALTLNFIPNTVITLTDTVVATDQMQVRTIGAARDQGAYWEYDITILSEIGGGIVPGEATDIFAEEPVASPTAYKQDTAYWGPGITPSWAGITGFKQYDGVDQPGNSDTAFGIDIAFQELSKSDDWDVFGLPSGGGGGGGGGGELESHVLNFHDDVDTVTTPPAVNDFLQFDGTNWVPVAVAPGASFWSANGDDIYNNNVGSVGIGTSTPGFPFHVKMPGTVPAIIESSDQVAAFLGLTNTAAVSGVVIGAIVDDLVMQTDNVARIQINSGTGNVGIGTGTATNRLHVYDGNILCERPTAIPSLATKVDYAPTGAQQIGRLIAQGVLPNGSDAARAGQLSINADSAWTNTSAPTNMTFHTTNNGSVQDFERMRITPDGKLLIGYTTASGGERVRVNGSILASNGVFATGASAITGGNLTTHTIVPQNNNSYNLGANTFRWNQIYYNGGVLPSDPGLKEAMQNLVPGLDFLSTVVPKEFNWKDRNIDGKRILGFDASQLRQAQLAYGLNDHRLAWEEDGELFHDPHALIPILVNAIKDLKNEIDTLRSDAGL